MISGIERVCISVADMAESLAFYCDIMQLSVVGDQVLDPATITALWNLPEGTTARAVMLKNDIQSTLVELIEFKPHSGRYIRDGAENIDIGLFDLALVVKDLEKSYQFLTEKGFRFSTPPMNYSPAFHPQLKVRYSICIVPNRMPAPHVQYIAPPPAPMEKDYGKFMDSAQFVEDMEAALKFYRDILGLKVISKAPFPAGMLDDLIGLPRHTEGTIALLNQEGSTAPLLELIELSVKGRDLSSIAVPPNIGLFGLAFQTDNLKALLDKLRPEGFVPCSGPLEMTLAPYGRIRTALVKGPSRVLLEFYEILNE